VWSGCLRRSLLHQVSAQIDRQQVNCRSKPGEPEKPAHSPTASTSVCGIYSTQRLVIESPMVNNRHRQSSRPCASPHHMWQISIDWVGMLQGKQKQTVKRFFSLECLMIVLYRATPLCQRVHCT